MPGLRLLLWLLFWLLFAPSSPLHCLASRLPVGEAALPVILRNRAPPLVGFVVVVVVVVVSPSVASDSSFMSRECDRDAFIAMPLLLLPLSLLLLLLIPPLLLLLLLLLAGGASAAKRHL